MLTRSVGTGVAIRVRGLVQGVGFRPMVWRAARAFGLSGDVCNDGEGVLIRAWAPADAAPDLLDRFCARLRLDCPPLARIAAIESGAIAAPAPDPPGFVILASASTGVQTGVVADAATCAACAAQVLDPADRRYRYPFTNCTHCGPRLSILRAIPYDRANTSMGVFALCPACASEYQDPADRRFHAQPNACPVCGPRVWLADRVGQALDPADLGAVDAIAAAARLLGEGRILAIKGIGGFHLACDAADAAAVSELRRRKRRFGKPFALMARDLAVIRRYARVGEGEAALLASPAAPIVLLERLSGPELAPQLAPGQSTLGFMLPYSPLHLLLLAHWERPLVMTSGNLSEEPQCIDNTDALARLGGLADFALLHDRVIVNRVDDSVVRWMDGAPRLLRRARGYAPAPIAMPPGFADCAPVLAMGGELKNTVCLLRNGQAILTQHLGDLEEAHTAREYEQTIDLYQSLFEHAAQRIAVDLHPDYRSSLTGRERAAREGLELIQVQHHHAHIAAVLTDNGWPLDGGPVLGIALDGLGYGADGTLWGGEFLAADYRCYRRVGWLRPVPMPGGTRAILEPWRNLVAQIEVCLGWDEFLRRWPGLELSRRLAERPVPQLRILMARRLNAPLSSSAGRLFDAVAAALGLCAERIGYEGQAAIELESLAVGALADAGEGYPFGRIAVAGRAELDPSPLWVSLFDDLAAGVPAGQISVRFHQGFCRAVADLAADLAAAQGLRQVALSGGVFQNRLVLEGVCQRLRRHGFAPLTHHQVPANDGGLALGQAAIAAAWGA
ncbi:carbamoyltransferase HypF [uncultured Thiodictyon sp.]|uniref:carbamoyltransferase HypF n=1 Tax=uncultured Thiodictyon sp. TaxID=1846217 RepID=UPI0025D3DF50|nr:carbamoyltransferase HypF [uncultured Thiodictyon sp.]